MSRDLLAYFNREVTWFKRALTAFAEANPQAGANLRLGDNLVEDPHVSRLVESVALLNSRIHARIEDDFPLIIQSFLDHLYPYYLAPKPSMIIAQFQPATGVDGLVELPRGAMFETEKAAGTHCRFMSCYDSTLTPLEISSACLLAKPFSTPGSNRVKGADSVLELKFQSSSDDFDLADESELNSLLIHIKSGALAWKLHDLILGEALDIYVASSDLDPTPTRLDAGSIQRVGFADDELLLPRTPETASVYQDLLEFFAYPEKHLFFRLTGLRAALARCNHSFSCYIYLRESDSELEKQVDRESLALHCTPLINLFRSTCEPQRIKPATSEYLVTPDIRSVGDMEVYAINRVAAVEDGSAEATEVAPYCSVEHGGTAGSIYWHGERRQAINQTGHRRGVTDYLLSLSSRESGSVDCDRHTLHIQALCSNANLPASLPFGGGSPHFTPEEPLSGLKGASSLTPPTPVKRLNLDQGMLWRLLSHLNLNYLSLVGDKDGAAQLREILRLYDFGDTPKSRAIVESIDSVKSQIVSLPIVVDGRPVVCRGVDFSITFDVSLLEIGSALLFGETLQRFLSKYVSINSFIRLTARIKGRDGVYRRWEPEVGSRALI